MPKLILDEPIISNTIKKPTLILDEEPIQEITKVNKKLTLIPDKVEPEISMDRNPKYSPELTDEQRAQAVIELIAKEKGEKVPLGLKTEWAITSPQAKAVVQAALVPEFTILQGVRGTLDNSKEYDLMDRITRGIVEPDKTKRFYQHIKGSSELPDWAKTTANVVEDIVGLGGLGAGKNIIRNNLLSKDISRKIAKGAEEFANANMNKFIGQGDINKIKESLKAEYTNEFIKKATAIEIPGAEMGTLGKLEGGTGPSILQEYAANKSTPSLLLGEAKALGNRGSVLIPEFKNGATINYTNPQGIIEKAIIKDITKGKAVLDIGGKEIITSLSQLSVPQSTTEQNKSIPLDYKPEVTTEGLKNIIKEAKQAQGKTELPKVDKTTYEGYFNEAKAKNYSDLGAKQSAEIKTLKDLENVAEINKAKISENSPIGSKDRLDYGISFTKFKDFESDIISKAKDPKKKFIDVVSDVGGTVKSIAASFDNSFFGRQGLITLFNEPDIWGKNFVKSFGDISKELKGKDAMLPIKADVYSRPNAINGKYKDIGLDIGIGPEESFPSSLPGKVPGIKRIYKASETAFNGAAIRFRADLADRWIEQAEAQGVDVRDPNSNIGKAINAITGRGDTGKVGAETLKTLNTIFFSPKYVKSTLDVLSAPFKYAGDKIPRVGPLKNWEHIPKESKFAAKKAAEATVKLILGIAGTLFVAKMIDPESVEEDPRSSRFGKIWVGKKHDIPINITGGFNSLITLASRLLPTTHKGKWGTWSKNSKGKYIQTNVGKYGTSTPIDFVSWFITGKTSPLVTPALNFWRGQTYQGEKPTIKGAITTAITPIPAQNIYQLSKTSAGADPLLFTILTALDMTGFNVGAPNKKK